MNSIFPLTISRRRIWIFAALVVALMVAVILGIGFGTVSLRLPEIISALTGAAPNPIVTGLRLPRVLAAVLVGAALGVCGAASQGLFRNPLADPYLMGTAAGASFGVTLAISVMGGMSQPFSQTGFFAHVPVSASLFGFLGAILAVGLVLVLSGGASRTHDMVLAGVVVGSVLVALSSYLMLRDADRIRAVFAYTLGNLSFMGWVGIKVISISVALCLPVIFLMGHTLNTFALGEETARSLGLPVARLKLVLIGIISFLTAVAVANAGIIGFVGLIAPHAMRRLTGGDYRFLLPASALGGAVLLTLADLASRVIVAPGELPVGLTMTLIGGPFFLYLLWRGRAKGSR